LGEQLVLVNLSDDHIFELNRTAARIWELIGEGPTRDELLVRLADEFAVDRAELAEEVDSLLQTLLSRDLLSVSAPAGE
jgi:hypothetical protein